MSPDVEELIQKINTLTVDKNRLRQKLAQLTNGPCVVNSANKSGTRSINQTNSSDSSSGGYQNISSSQSSSETRDLNDGNQFKKNHLSDSKGSIEGAMTNNANSIGVNERVIAGIECSSSCEEDMSFMNDLLKKKLDEYVDNWDHLQSKCAALLSELSALQKHYALLKREKSELEDRYKLKCDDYENLKSELQTVVLNYETQLSAMSEHLSMITSRTTPD